MSFCTYVNGDYLIKVNVCIYTLLKQDPSMKMYVLCFDNIAFQGIKNLNKKQVIPIKMADFEKKFPQIPAIKNTRTQKDYFVTTKPFLPEYIFQEFKEDKTIFVDADMAFWSDPNEIFDIYKNHSLLVTDHELVPVYESGRFNVGLVGFKNDPNCKEFLDWWQKKCINWCKWEEHKNGWWYAEQGYLNVLHDNPNKFKGVLSCPNPGVNLGPWNIAKHKLFRNKETKKVTIQGNFNLITYHYHEFRMTGQDTYRPTGWKVTGNDLQFIYVPYVELFKKSRDGKLW
jgi:hypothetical protein